MSNFLELMLVLLFLPIPISLSVWRMTYMLMSEDGPFHVFEKLRKLGVEETVIKVGNGEYAGRHTRIKNIIGEVTTCFYCCSVWTAAPLAVFSGYLVSALSNSDIGLYLGVFVGVIIWLESSTVAIYLELARRWLDGVILGD